MSCSSRVEITTRGGHGIATDSNTTGCARHGVDITTRGEHGLATDSNDHRLCRARPGVDITTRDEHGVRSRTWLLTPLSTLWPPTLLSLT